MSVVLRGSTVNSFYRRSNHRRANVSGHMSSHEVGSAKSRSGQSGRVITAKPHRDVKSVEDLTNHVIPNFGMGNSDRLPNLEKTKSDSGAAAGFFIPTDFLPIVSLKFKTFFSYSFFKLLPRSSKILIDPNLFTYFFRNFCRFCLFKITPLFSRQIRENFHQFQKQSPNDSKKSFFRLFRFALPPYKLLPKITSTSINIPHRLSNESLW